ncbi:ABC transporter substrate-binding protein [Paenibacillus sp. GYB003]|uniref:ABC transporter substrate-binding protein n=1 Tax=Paenibacillus sp. GYB003 TaxID=2994392 RepID=UPI002F962D22
MQSLKRAFQWIAGGVLLAVMSGCGAADVSKGEPPSTTAEPRQASSPSGPASEQAKPFLTFQDDAGRTVTVPSKPQRIVALSPQLLDLLYEVDGRAIARTTSPGTAVPDKAKDVEAIGGITSVHTEKLLALKPDLVVGSPSFHKNLAELMDRSGIPFAMLGLGTYEDLRQKAALFGKLADSESKAAERLAKLERDIADITAKVPDKTPSFVMLNVTPTSISVQRANTVGLEAAGMLRMRNAAETLEPTQNSPTTAPFSMEKLVQLNPDYVFILIHGARADGENKIEADLAAQPAWASLRAVKEKRMAVLPSDLLLSNPGFRLNESVAYLAKLVYPEIYGNGG